MTWGLNYHANTSRQDIDLYLRKTQIVVIYITRLLQEKNLKTSVFENPPSIELDSKKLRCNPLRNSLIRGDVFPTNRGSVARIWLSPPAPHRERTHSFHFSVFLQVASETGLFPITPVRRASPGTFPSAIDRKVSSYKDILPFDFIQYQSIVQAIWMSFKQCW